ncbi:MAG: hypothetical protein EKK55_07920 [Rhodocyclaceae bacterium]|nr:MAG: hypothetical protein EKK55_07920 [Rhodocyclaceae bacterium]
MTTYKIVNEFHNFAKETKSGNPATIRKIVRASKPSDCKSKTAIYRLVDGAIDAEMAFNGHEFRVAASM